MINSAITGCFTRLSTKRFQCILSKWMRSHAAVFNDFCCIRCRIERTPFENVSELATTHSFQLRQIHIKLSFFHT